MFAVVLAFGCPSALLLAIAAGESTMEGVLSPFETVLGLRTSEFGVAELVTSVGEGCCVVDERRGGSSASKSLSP